MTIVHEATSENIKTAAQALANGRLVAFPTETVYGLGALASNNTAVASIFTTKERPQTNPLIVHVANIEAAEKLAIFSDTARKLAAAFWPGPMTLVLPKHMNALVSDRITAGNTTIALRIPAHALAQELLKTLGQPIAAPSANRSGHVSPTTAAHVAADFATRDVFILDGGPTTHGLESTIIAATGDTVTVLRPGSITQDMISDALGREVDSDNRVTQTPNAPGQLASHYAPNALLRLNATSINSNEALLAFGANVPPHSGPMLNLSPTGSLDEAAANLFSALRALDTANVSRIAVMPIPKEGVGIAINDRLERAAAPRNA